MRRDKSTSRPDKLVEEIRFNEKYAHLFYSEYIPEKFSSESLPTIKRKTLFTDDYIKRLIPEGVEGGMIPPNVRYIEETEKGYMVVIEEPPAYRTIKTVMSMNKEISKLKSAGKLEMMGYETWKDEARPPYSFTLAFPYVIFLLYVSKYNEIQDGQVFLRTQQMSGMSDYLFKMPMCNISDSGHICFGDKIHTRAQSLTAAVQHAIMVWWSASFNTDYTYNYNAYSDIPVLNSYLEWQYMSQANPMFIYNADWIKESYTIGTRIQQSKGYLSIRGKQTMGYKELADIFYQTQDTGVEVKPSKRSRKTVKLFYDIAQGTFLDSHTNVNVGDSFETAKGKMAFVSSFVGFPDGSDARYIQLDINGHTCLCKINSSSRKFLAKQITKQRRADTATLSNGTVVEPGQILVVKQGMSEVFYKADYIRKSRGFDNEEVLEVKLGNNYFLTSNLDAKIFNVDNPEIDGIALNKEDQYIILGDSTHAGARVNGYRMKYHSIDVSKTGQVVVRFVNAHPQMAGHDRHIQMSQATDRKMVYHFDEAKRLSGIYRCGRKMFGIPGGSLNDPKPEVSWGINGVLLWDGNLSMKNVKGSYTKQLIDGDRFFIEGADFDTEFVIGDKVVVANWQEPLDVLTVKMLQGFKYDESNGNISFILIDKEGKLSEVLYVDGYRGIIKTGYIRKVTNKVGRLSAGTKIQATTAGIPCFPKKDVNIIVAFVIDTGREPLALCSNGCTLWVGDLEEHFKKTTLKSKKWPTMEHAPLDLSKIKFQAGDIINGMKDYKSHYGYLLYGPSTTRALRAMPVEYITGYPESYALDRYMTRECRLECIPAPRVTPSKIAEVGVLRGILNLHSYDVFEHPLTTRYLNQRRA